MKYLLDSDTLIRSKNDSYRFDSHPGFWNWLEQCNVLDLIGSVQTIRRELAKEDQLANWVKKQGSRFFVSVDAATTKSISEIAKWVSEHPQFSSAAKQAFFASADLTLVAHAHAHGCKVVTFEKDEPDSVHDIKIPTVCNQFGVGCINIYQLISELGPKFVLEA